MSSNARELSGVLLTVQAALPALRNKQVLVETQQGDPGLHQPPGRSLSLPQRHRTAAVDDVLQQPDPAHGRSSPGQGQSASRPTFKVEEGSHRHSASAGLLRSDRAELRSALGRHVRYSRQCSPSSVRLVEARSRLGRDRCLHVPDEKREPLLFSSGRMHPSPSSRGAASTSDHYPRRPGPVSYTHLTLPTILLV